MSTIGLEVLKIALHDAVEKQRFITAELQELQELPEQSNVRKLVAEQSQLIEKTLTLLNRIA
jgi:RecB family endonuclease NucS